MNIESMPSPNHTKGRSVAIREVVAHWWDKPEKNPTLAGTVAHLRNPAPGGNPARAVSAHYVVSGNRIIRLVSEDNTAWHAGNANPFTIGIEIDPNVPGNTYKTVGWLVNDIRRRRGALPLVPHKKYVNTQCPGTISLSRIEQEAKGDSMADITKGMENELAIGVTGKYPGAKYNYRHTKKNVSTQDIREFVQFWRSQSVVPKLNKRIKELEAGGEYRLVTKELFEKI